MIPIAQREQARQPRFSSPKKPSNTPSSTLPAQPQVQSGTKMHNLQRNLPQKDTDIARPAPPPLTVATNFSRHRQPSLHRHGSSIQERRKRKAPSPAVSNPLSALSPSEGTLVIGISLQPGTLELHNTPQSLPKSTVPDIVISPIEKPADHSRQAKDWRPRSSVYSQMTRLSRSFSTGQIPPIPQLPVLNQRTTKPRPTSAVSWHTDFSDDNQDMDHRRFSRNTEPGNLAHLNIPTVGQESDGWWNTMLSPIFGRSNTIFRKPEDKSIAGNSKQIIRHQDTAQALTLDTAIKAHSPSIWDSLDRVDAERQTLAFFANSPLVAQGSVNAMHGTSKTPEIVQEGGFGLASEYYEATWHDAYSPTPFFSCCGHDCGQKVTYRHGKTLGGPDAEPALPKLTATNLASIQPVPINDVTKHFRAGEAVRELGSDHRPQTPNHVRNDSTETFIEDAPDAKSEFKEASPMLSSTTDSPRPRAQNIPRQKMATDAKTTPTAINVVTPPNAKSTRNIPRLQDLRGLSDSGSISRFGLAISHSKSDAVPERKNVGATGKIVAGSALDDPFHDIHRCESPESYGSPHRKEAISRKGTPQQPLRALTPASTDIGSVKSARYDPLKIDEPRKAPSPPRSVLSQHTLYAQSTGSGSTLGLPNAAFSKGQKSEGKSRTITGVVPVNEKAALRPGNQLGRSNLYLSTDDLVSEKISSQLNGDRNKNATGAAPSKLSKKTKEDKKRKRWYFVIGGALLALVILIVILVLLFTLHRNDAPVQTTWLNITGFPPVPTGVATIAQPNAAIEESRCVAPNTLWSCAVPKEQQAAIAPNLPDQPNFRLEIRFQNDSSALNSNSSLTRRSLGRGAIVRASSRSRIMRVRDAFTTSLFSPNPAPPSSEDQTFLGNTTDNNTMPFGGEATPFFISFLPTTAAGGSTSALSTRDSTDSFPNVTNSIPPPSTNSDGTALAANLLPFPSAQPLMLYNRGRADEHYGFYTYFDRSIFLKSTDLLNSTGPDIPDNYNGGAAADAADVRCTWAQTRFLVQIWTNAGSALQLLASNNTSGSNSSSNSANNFVQPGSFPYPVSITLDRHGGDVKQKMVYCYGMDENQHIISSEKQVHLENRDFGGTGLVNPGNRLFGPSANVSLADGGPGGIDGGFGGCQCQWRNWVET